jgi:hypothetical protein
MIIIQAKQSKSNKTLEDTIELLSKLKKELKSNDIVKEVCKEFGFDTDIIDGVPIEFSSDIDVSAKTVDSHIMLNYNLIDDDFEVIMRYAIHELVHSLQHMKREGINSDDAKDYLDRDDEMEAFQRQIQYQQEEVGDDNASKYVDDLVEYHEVPNDEKDDKKKELLEKTK